MISSAHCVSALIRERVSRQGSMKEQCSYRAIRFLSGTIINALLVGWWSRALLMEPQTTTFGIHFPVTDVARHASKTMACVHLRLCASSCLHLPLYIRISIIFVSWECTYLICAIYPSSLSFFHSVPGRSSLSERTGFSLFGNCIFRL